MPEGLQYLLSGKLPEQSRISVVGYDSGPSLIMDKLIKEMVHNCLEVAEGNKAHVHLILLANDISQFRVSPHQINSDLTVYDYVRSPCDSIEQVYEEIMKTALSKPGRPQVLIVDDYALFAVMCCERNVQREGQFLKLLSGRGFKKIVLFFNTECVSKEEMMMISGISSDIACLTVHPDSAKVGTVSGWKFLCLLLKMRMDRKVSHETSTFTIVEDEIKEEMVHEFGEKGRSGSSSSEVLKNLTTFKLTLEDDEKESKNRLHLPYFEAQKTSLDNPTNYEDYEEEDEEDEEV